MRFALESTRGAKRIPIPGPTTSHMVDFYAGTWRDFPPALTVKTLKRAYARVTPSFDARKALGPVDGWIADYDTFHPHSALRMRSPAEFRAALNPSRNVR